jgi:hypothetical protein
MTHTIQQDDQVRPANEQETAVIESVREDYAAQLAALETAAAAKTSARAKLKALGLTDDEIVALVG